MPAAVSVRPRRSPETSPASEPAEQRAEAQALLKWLFVAKVVSAGLIILGFGLFFQFQLG